MLILGILVSSCNSPSNNTDTPTVNIDYFPLPTQTVINSSSNPASLFEPVIFTGKVIPIVPPDVSVEAVNRVPLTGTLTFKIDDKVICNNVPINSLTRSAQCETKFNDQKTRNVTANYTTDNTYFLNSESSVYEEKMGSQIGTKTTILLDTSAHIDLGNKIELSALVQSYQANDQLLDNINNGTVTFKIIHNNSNSERTLCENVPVNSSKSTCNAEVLEAGSTQFKAEYKSNEKYKGSDTISDSIIIGKINPIIYMEFKSDYINTLSSPTIVWGDAVTINVCVGTENPLYPTPNGSMKISGKSNVTCNKSSEVCRNNQIKFTCNFNPKYDSNGNFTYTAEYSNDINYNNVNVESVPVDYKLNDLQIQNSMDVAFDELNQTYNIIYNEDISINGLTLDFIARGKNVPKGEGLFIFKFTDLIADSYVNLMKNTVSRTPNSIISPPCVKPENSDNTEYLKNCAKKIDYATLFKNSCRINDTPVDNGLIVSCDYVRPVASKYDLIIQYLNQPYTFKFKVDSQIPQVTFSPINRNDDIPILGQNYPAKGCGLTGTVSQRIFDCSKKFTNFGFTVIPGTLNNTPGRLEPYIEGQSDKLNTWFLVGCPDISKDYNLNLNVKKAYAQCTWVSPTIQTGNPIYPSKSGIKLYDTGYDNPNTIVNLNQTSLNPDNPRFLWSGEVPRIINSTDLNDVFREDFCIIGLGNSCKEYFSTKDYNICPDSGNHNQIQPCTDKRTKTDKNYNFPCQYFLEFGLDIPESAWQVPSYPMAYTLTGGKIDKCNEKSSEDYLKGNENCSSVYGFYAAELPGFNVSYDNNLKQALWTATYYGTSYNLAWGFNTNGTMSGYNRDEKLPVRCVAPVWLP